MKAATEPRRRKQKKSADGHEKSRKRHRSSRYEPREDYGPLGRPIWSGSISFGLVNIPVRLHTAVREQRIAFHMLHDQDKVRLRRRMVCPAHEKEIHPEHLVRGFEVEKDKYVIVRDEDLEGCAPEKSKNIEITDFVELGEIDPRYFDRPYYVIPQAGSSKPYRLLAEAMKRYKRVGLARLVMHEREHLVAIRPFDGLLCLETMHFADELVPLGEIEDLPRDLELTDRETKAAGQIIREMSDEFDPKDYRDDYQKCVRAMVEKKSRGENLVTVKPDESDGAESEKPTRSASNLMAALEASLAKARGDGAPSKRRKRHA